MSAVLESPISRRVFEPSEAKNWQIVLTMGGVDEYVGFWNADTEEVLQRATSLSVDLDIYAYRVSDGDRERHGRHETVKLTSFLQSVAPGSWAKMRHPVPPYDIRLGEEGRVSYIHRETGAVHGIGVVNADRRLLFLATGDGTIFHRLRRYSSKERPFAIDVLGCVDMWRSRPINL